MATVNVVLRSNIKNKQGKSPLRIRLLTQEQIKEITIPGIRITKGEWDEKRQKLKSDKMANLRIESLVLKYKQEIHQVQIQNQTVDLNAVHYAVSQNQSVAKKNKKQHSKKVWKYIDENICNEMSLAYGTRKNYGTLSRLLKKDYPKWRIDEISGKELKQLADKLKKKGLKLNTIHSRAKCLKAAVNRAFEKGHINKPDWRGFINRKETPNKKPLTEGELKLNLVNKVNTKLLILSCIFFS